MIKYYFFNYIRINFNKGGNMNNIVEYFYKIKPQNMIKIGVNYRFEYNNEIYYFEIYN